MREPVTKVFRRAGCGKSARPVRRGDGAPRILIRYASSYSTGQYYVLSQPNISQNNNWPPMNTDERRLRLPDPRDQIFDLGLLRGRGLVPQRGLQFFLGLLFLARVV